jgi:hypothetical protein
VTFDAAILAQLDPRTILTVQVEAGALLKAMLAQQGGPEWLSTGEARRLHGRSAPYWRQRAEEWAAADAGKPAQRAYQEPSGRWFLRNESCREHLATKAAPATRSRRKLRGPRQR